MYCSTRNESHIDGMTQEKCQAACIQDSKCVGIAYSYKEGKTHRCYTCTEDNLTDAPDNFGFYRRPGSALGYRFQLCIFDRIHLIRVNTHIYNIPNPSYLQAVNARTLLVKTDMEIV